VIFGIICWRTRRCSKVIIMNDRAEKSGCIGK
jgi:hypothetical protein